MKNDKKKALYLEIALGRLFLFHYHKCFHEREEEYFLFTIKNNYDQRSISKSLLIANQKQNLPTGIQFQDLKYCFSCFFTAVLIK